jgi:hypothetical protein
MQLRKRPITREKKDNSNKIKIGTNVSFYDEVFLLAIIMLFSVSHDIIWGIFVASWGQLAANFDIFNCVNIYKKRLVSDSKYNKRTVIQLPKFALAEELKLEALDEEVFHATPIKSSLGNIFCWKSLTQFCMRKLTNI